jgi:putative Mn2+ efflux pump MntP
MNLFLAFFIGLAVNLDNLLIGIHLGLQGRRLPLWQNLVIGCATGGCAFLSTAAARLISGNIFFYTNLCGAGIMILFGIFCFYQCLTKAQEADPLRETPDYLEPGGILDVLALGFLLAVNCIPPSISAGVMGLSPWWIGLFSLLFSFLGMEGSMRMGDRLHHSRFPGYITPISAGLMILIGVAELLL